jgi:hypothetical protein
MTGELYFYYFDALLRILNSYVFPSAFNFISNQVVLSKNAASLLSPNCEIFVRVQVVEPRLVVVWSVPVWAAQLVRV